MNVIFHLRTSIILFLLLANWCGAYAQEFPVQVTPVLPAPYSLYLSDYASPESNFQLIIQLRELDRPEYKVKLRMSIEGQGVTISTRPAYVPPAIVLQGGVTEMLSGADLKNYFNPDNLDFIGISKQDFIKKGALPEGFYTFRFEVIDYVRNVVVSNTGFANAWIILNDPPIINLPFNTEKVLATDPQNVTFSWTPRHTASPNAAFTTEYEFTMVELYPDTRNPNDAIRVSRPIFVTETSSTSLNYGITETLLIPGRKYAFRIKAFDTEGRDLFKNNGYSEVFVFQFGDACIPPASIKAEALDEARIKLTWEASDLHTGYGIQYRKKGSATWNDQNLFTNSAIIPGLQASTTYEYKVKGVCGTIQGEYSVLATVATLEGNPNEFACGTPAPAIEIKTTPLQNDLEVDDLIKTADFEITVEEVAKNPDGSYKGTGIAFLPWFNFATVKVKFKDIKVNEDYRVYSGDVVTIYSKSSKFIANVDLHDEEKDNEDGEGGSGAGGDNFVAPDTVTLPVDVKEIIVDLGTNPDVILVVAADGTTQEIPREKSEDGKSYEDTVVKDSNGDTWIVGKDGKVSEGPSTGAPDALTSMDGVDYIVKFAPVAEQEYGFDAKDSPLGTYEKATIRDKDYNVSWKSVETGRQDRVAAIADGESLFPGAVGFKINDAEAPSQASSNAAQKHVFITGKAAGTEESLSAYVTVKESDDNEAQEVELGKLNIKTYDKIRKKVVIVPVNQESPVDAASLQTELNSIYKSAVVEWDVEIAPKFEYEPNDLVGLDAEESDIFSSFPEKMQIFNRTFANNTWADAGSYYLFLIKGSGSKRTGFMPFKRKYGYIFNDAIRNIEATIAHELGHGAFRLRHTFSPEAKYANEGSTNNLMDYNNGTGTVLRKYQWDLVHDPENTNGWLEADDESGSEVKYFNVLVSSQLNLQELGFTTEVNYVCPDGSIITLPATAVVSFTGVTHDVELDKAIIKGSLLGFKLGDKSYLARFRPKDTKWTFNGYVESGTNHYHVGVAGSSSAKKVLVGKEGPQCLLDLVTGTFEGKPYVEKTDLPIKEGIVALTGEVIAKSLTMKDCDQIYKTASAKYFLAEARRVHGDALLNDFKEIAGTIDKLGDNWFADFKSEHKEPRFPSPNVRYVDVLSPGAKPEDIAAFLKMIRAYESNKQTNFNKIVDITVQEDLLDLLKGFTINDYKELSIAQRKHILNVLATGELGGTYFHENGEGFALKVLTHTSKAEDVTALLTYMETTVVDGSVLAVKLMQRIDDGILGFIGGDNYKLLMTEYSAMVTRSTSFADKIKNLLEVNFNQRLINWQVKTEQSIGAIVSHYYIDEKGTLTINRSEITELNSVTVESETVIMPKYNPLSPLTLGAFDLVVFVNLGNLEIINEASGAAAGEMAIVPAIFIKYAQKKGTNDAIATAASLAVDAITIVFTAGTLTAAKNLTRLRKAWLIFELSNATLNATINLSGLAKDPEWKPVIDNYNMVMCLLAVGELSYNGVKNADAILYKVSNAAEASADAIKTTSQKFYNALKSIDPSKLSAEARKAYDKLTEFAQKLKVKYGLVDDLLVIASQKIKASVIDRIGTSFSIKLSDAELLEIVDAGKKSKLGDDDIEAILLVHCRKNTSKEQTLEILNSLVAKNAANNIKFKSDYNFWKAYREAQVEMISGGYLDPVKYLDEGYIASHLAKFKPKASYLVTGDSYRDYINGVPLVGRPKGVYISTTEKIDEVLSKAKGNIGIIETELGIPGNTWKNRDGIYRIDVDVNDGLNVRMPYGHEEAANYLWHPGGFTSGGVIEAVVNQIPQNLIKAEQIIK